MLLPPLKPWLPHPLTAALSRRLPRLSRRPFSNPEDLPSLEKLPLPPRICRIRFLRVACSFPAGRTRVQRSAFQSRESACKVVRKGYVAVSNLGNVEIIRKFSSRNGVTSVFEEQTSCVPHLSEKEEGEGGKEPGKRRKKKVAMWLSYSGSGYRGLQIQRSLSEGPPTVEEVLEKAILAAGGMLPSNFGNLAKVGWTRSSRTDKGVHSMATIVSLHLEVPLTAWEGDPEGAELAADINAHLPSDVRVWNVLPVARSFSARKFCKARTYHYLLPVGVLGLEKNFSEDDVDRTLDKLKSVLCEFEGKHAFHNYTVRRLYRPPPPGTQGWKKGKKKQKSKSQSGIRKDLDAVDGEPLSEGKENSEGTKGAQRSFNTFAEPLEGAVNTPETDGKACHENDADTVVGREYRSTDVPENGECKDGEDLEIDDFWGDPESDGEEEGELRSGGGEGPLGERKLRDERTAYWLYEPQAADRVGSAHFRIIKECTCGGVEDFEGTQFVRVMLTGESFMLHQVRKMVGTAVAVVRGQLKAEVVPVSLSRHCRMVLPLAPPEGLLLYGSEFFPFRAPTQAQKEAQGLVEGGHSAGGVRDDSEESRIVSLSRSAKERMQTFWSSEVLPVMLPSLKAEGDPWREWLEHLHRKPLVSEGEAAAVLKAWEERHAEVVARKASTDHTM